MRSKSAGADTTTAHTTSASSGDGKTLVAAAALLAAGAVYTVISIWLARDRQLGNDELFTLYFARLPGIGDVWRQLSTGVEQTPPLFYVVTRTSLRLFGDNSIALRLPELAGTFLAAVCSLVAVARRSTLLYGGLAALILLGSQAAFYAHEARPYGLFLGLVAAGFLCWQLRCDERGGSVVVAVLALVLMAAVATHYYAVLAVLPIVIGEAVRTAERRRPDRLVLAALGLSLLPLLAALPLIEAARAYSGSFWTEFTWRSALEFNGWLFRTSAVSGDLAPRLGLSLVVWVLCGISAHAILAPRRWRVPGRDSDVVANAAPALRRFTLVACLGVAVAATIRIVGGPDALSDRDLAYAVVAGGLVIAYGFVARRRFAELTERARESSLRVPEVAAACAFLFVPAVAVALAKLSTGAYTPRYVLPAALGVALLLPLGLHQLQGSRQTVAIVLTCILAVFVARVAWYQHLETDAEATERASIVSFLERNAAGSDLPIVIGHPQRFFELAHEPPPGLSGRLLHLSSTSLARRYIGSDSTEAGLLVLRRFAPLDVREFEQYDKTRSPFLLLLTADSSRWNWIVPALEAQGRSLRPVARADGMTLIEVR